VSHLKYLVYKPLPLDEHEFYSLPAVLRAYLPHARGKHHILSCLNPRRCALVKHNQPVNSRLQLVGIFSGQPTAFPSVLCSVYFVVSHH